MVTPLPRSDQGFIRQFTALLSGGALAGLLLAAMLLPVTSTVGVSARSSAQSFAKVANTLTRKPLSQRSRILAADGSVLAHLYNENRVSVPLTAMAPVMRQAIIAIEDSRFYQHGGADVRGTLRAALTNTRSGSVKQGGSTLTQQYVKNVLISQATTKEEAQAARALGLPRKIRELHYAIQIEKELTKDQILENYLNISYFGGGAYGVEAAAEHYFSKDATQLTLPEAAMLAGLVQSPAIYEPSPHHTGRALNRRNTVIDRMAQLRMISPQQAASAKTTTITLKTRNLKRGCTSAGSAAFFCDYVSRIIQTDPVFGKTREDRTQLLFRGGLTIHTTLDPKMQKAAQRALDRHVHASDTAASAISLVEPGSGATKAMAQSRPYGNTGGLNLNVDNTHGGGAGFQAGSTFKPYVAAAALEQGMSPGTSFYAPYQVWLNGPFRTCGGTNSDRWEPSNERRDETGVYDMRGAMEKSVNTYFAQLEERTGICAPKRVAERLGVKRADGQPLQEYKSFTLGTNEVSPLAMAEAYATFAARGTHCQAVVISAVTGIGGKRYPIPSAGCQNVLDPQVADTVNDLLQGVVKRGSGTRAAIDRPSAGKTGTTDARVAVWYVGYTPNMAAAVWVGKPEDNTYQMSGVTIGDKYYETVCGGCLPGPIWRDAMNRALRNVPAKRFTPGLDPDDAPEPKFGGRTHRRERSGRAESRRAREICRETRSTTPQSGCRGR